jgi:hypothetical protein
VEELEALEQFASEIDVELKKIMKRIGV